MYAELKIRVYLNNSELEEVGITAEEALKAMVVGSSDISDELFVTLNPLLMPDTWDVVSGPFVVSGGYIEERELVEESTGEVTK